MWSRKRLFISFDYDADRQYRYLLSAWSANAMFDVDFHDHTPSEIQSADIGRIKAVLTSKIRAATHTLVIVGQHANTRHRDSRRIGELNWQHWEIKRSLEEGKRIIAVKLNRMHPSPPALLGAGTRWVMNFSAAGVSAALTDR